MKNTNATGRQNGLATGNDGNDAPRYPYVSVDVGEEEAEEAGALLVELGAGGVEQRDATTLVPGRHGRPGLGGRVTGKVTLIASFETAEAAQAALAELPAGWTPRIDEVVGDLWRDEWKKYFEPFRLAKRVVVCPPWRDYVAAPGERVIVLEPGRAFGTGLHETTSLVADLLGELPLADLDVLDVGCGSGILALMALTLGAARAHAVDLDPDAVAVTRENAERNGLSPRLKADQTPVANIRRTFPIVLANIETQTLVDLAPDLIARVEPGGWLVLSGILAPQVAPSQLADIRRAFAAPLCEDSVRYKGEWASVVLRTPGERAGLG